MLINKLLADVEARAGVTKVFQIILGVSLLTNVLLAGGFMTMDKTVRTVLVPPEIGKTFWVDGHTIAPEYLEQMGTWAIAQFATASPSSVDYQAAQLLKYVHPSVYGDLAVRFKVGANRLKQDNMSKVFFPREVRMSEKGKSVALVGVQQTWIGDKRVPSDEQKAFLVVFDYDGSRTYIKELRETNPGKPFEAVSAAAANEADVAAQQQGQLVPQATPDQPAVVPVPVPQDASSVPQSGQSGSLPPAPQANSAATREALQAGAAPLPANPQPR